MLESIQYHLVISKERDTIKSMKLMQLYATLSITMKLRNVSNIFFPFHSSQSRIAVRSGRPQKRYSAIADSGMAAILINIDD